jgi:predicted AAA+ superfamily ATPase
MEVARGNWLHKIDEEFHIHPVCALLGPRQCGKTTLVKAFAEQLNKPVHLFDCENPLHLARLENPLLSLQNLEGLVVIDEVQRRPELFPVLRVLVDENPDRKYLITGSASRDLIHQSSESLAGRIGYHQVTPFSLSEIEDWRTLWLRGGYPRSYLATSGSRSSRWRDEYIRTFLERDLSQLGFDVTPTVAAKLWRMLAHVHGQTLNLHELAGSLGMDHRTVKRYLHILEGSFMISLLKPWHNNVSKREVKAPKVYIRDSGLLHRLLHLPQDDIENHPKLGFSFEGFAIEQITRQFYDTVTPYFWATHNGAELDLFIEHEGKRIGFEIKHTDSPKITKSMHIALADLNLDHLFIIIPGAEEGFDLAENVSCVTIGKLWSGVN